MFHKRLIAVFYTLVLLAALPAGQALAAPAAEGANPPQPEQPVSVLVETISAGQAFSCGLKNDGTLICWGNNSLGQSAPPAGLFRQVSAGQNHACGLMNNSTITCWGSDTSGQATRPAGTFSQVSVGGALNSIATTFNLGDDAADKQYRSILQFDTASLPDNAVIIKVTLRIKKQGLVGMDPFTVLGGLQVDMRKPSFGTAALAVGDFQAVPGRLTVATFAVPPVLNWYSAVLNSPGRAYVNKTGTTQFRLRFATDDNDNNLANTMRFFSGNAGVASRPQLIVEYYVP